MTQLTLDQWLELGMTAGHYELFCRVQRHHRNGFYKVRPALSLREPKTYFLNLLDEHQGHVMVISMFDDEAQALQVATILAMTQ